MGVRQAKSLLRSMKGEVTHLALAAQPSRGRAGLLRPPAQCVCCVGSNRAVLFGLAPWPPRPPRRILCRGRAGAGAAGVPGEPALGFRGHCWYLRRERVNILGSLLLSPAKNAPGSSGRLRRRGKALRPGAKPTEQGNWEERPPPHPLTLAHREGGFRPPVPRPPATESFAGAGQVLKPPQGWGLGAGGRCLPLWTTPGPRNSQKFHPGLSQPGLPPPPGIIGVPGEPPERRGGAGGTQGTADACARCTF